MDGLRGVLMVDALNQYNEMSIQSSCGLFTVQFFQLFCRFEILYNRILQNLFKRDFSTLVPLHIGLCVCICMYKGTCGSSRQYVLVFYLSRRHLQVCVGELRRCVNMKASQSSQLCATGQSNEIVTGRMRFSMQHMINEGMDMTGTVPASCVV